MRNVLIGIGVAAAAAVLGVGAAYGASELLKTYRPRMAESVPAARGWNAEDADHPLMNADGGMPWGMGGSGGIRERLKDFAEEIRDRRSGGEGRTEADRISMEEAVQAAEEYADGMGSNFEVAEVMEFEDNFYAVILEKDTGRGALEVLIDPYRGTVSGEPGPNMMWNGKYGGRMHRTTQSGDNELSLEKAREAAQEYLDRVHPGAKLEEGGYAFYGYYTFDYSVDGTIAGMLSVHGATGQIWEHTWHGSFVAEKELE
jgi:hypothetical protein